MMMMMMIDLLILTS